MFRSSFNRSKFNTGGVESQIDFAIQFSAQGIGQASISLQLTLTPGGFGALGNVLPLSLHREFDLATNLISTGGMASEFERTITSIVDAMESKGILSPSSIIREFDFKTALHAVGVTASEFERTIILFGQSINAESEFKNLSIVREFDFKTALHAVGGMLSTIERTITSVPDAMESKGIFSPTTFIREFDLATNLISTGGMASEFERTIILLGQSINAESEFKNLSVVRELDFQADMITVGGMSLSFERQLILSGIMHAEGGIQNVIYVREFVMKAIMSGQGELYSRKIDVNRPFFNRMAFNRPSFNKENLFNYAVELTPFAHMNVEGTMMTDFERLIGLIAQRMSGQSEMNAENIRERLFKALTQGKGTMEANGNRYTIEEFSFKNLNQGDTVIIDMDRLIVTKNNVNALNDFEGDFFNLHPGENTLTYTDGETQRTVNVQVRYRNRWY